MPFFSFAVFLMANIAVNFYFSKVKEPGMQPTQPLQPLQPSPTLQPPWTESITQW